MAASVAASTTANVASGYLRRAASGRAVSATRISGTVASRGAALDGPVADAGCGASCRSGGPDGSAGRGEPGGTAGGASGRAVGVGRSRSASSRGRSRTGAGASLRRVSTVATARKARTTASRESRARHRLPLVVLSPGFGNTRKTLTALAEDLASRGYVVAGIDHTYEAFGVTFPDGRVTTCVACQVENPKPAFWQKAERGRAADVSFVLDSLTGTRPAWRHAGVIDPDRIAMAGHSVGGASATTSMVGDRRIRAGLDIDGTVSEPLPETGLSRPFMFLGTQARHSPGQDVTWDRDWERLTGWKRWLVVTGAQHPSFTDVG
ncbi:MAG: alpha/beta hydrolase, partial [Streptosporangiales bacterium]|nr:alpha/beta hydrolase [Streptosporangiales bacterium]